MVKHSLMALLLVLLPVGPAIADDAPELAPLKFDEVNTPLADVIAKASAAQKPIFIDFFLDG